MMRVLYYTANPSRWHCIHTRSGEGTCPGPAPMVVADSFSATIFRIQAKPAKKRNNQS
jgi:hypothetical protein